MRLRIFSSLPSFCAEGGLSLACCCACRGSSLAFRISKTLWFLPCSIDSFVIHSVASTCTCTCVRDCADSHE